MSTFPVYFNNIFEKEKFMSISKKNKAKEPKFWPIVAGVVVASVILGVGAGAIFTAKAGIWISGIILLGSTTSFGVCEVVDFVSNKIEKSKKEKKSKNRSVGIVIKDLTQSPLISIGSNDNSSSFNTASEEQSTGQQIKTTACGNSHIFKNN